MVPFGHLKAKNRLVAATGMSRRSLTKTDGSVPRSPSVAKAMEGKVASATDDSRDVKQ